MEALGRSRQLPVLAVLLVCTPALSGWGESGHRVVARATQEILSERSKSRVRMLLGREAELVDVAQWADETALERPETAGWHAITIPPGADGVDLKRDCPLGECLPAKARECIGIVRLAIRNRGEIVDAFKMLVGLSAHMHQPLLNGYPPSLAPENAHVVLGGTEMPLMDAWEHGLVAYLGSEEEVLDLVRKRIAASDYDEVVRGTLRSWTWETHRVASERIYPAMGGNGATVLHGAALDAATETVVDQLAKAAMRLNHILTLIWP